MMKKRATKSKRTAVRKKVPNIGLLPDDHPAGVGACAAGAGIMGALIGGAVGGPVGAEVGAVGGGAVGCCFWALENSTLSLPK